MPESPAGSAAFLNGEEIVNDARTLAYLDAGYGPPSLQVNGCCACPRIKELIDCDESPYTTPAEDPAPWYDNSVPESADFAGFLTVEFMGLGSTYARGMIDKVTGGAVLGRLRVNSRPMTWRGFLFGRSDTAVRYGLSWMTANLKGNNCICGGEELDLMVSCPELENVEIDTCIDLPPVANPLYCPPYTQPEAFRTLKNVGLADGPKILSQRRVGCKCGGTECGGESVITEIEFTLIAGNPYLHGCAVCLCADRQFDETSVDLNCDYIKLVPDESALPEACQPEPECSLGVDCTEGDTLCDPVDLPNIPEFTDRCFCDPVFPTKFCCHIPADAFGQFFEGAPLIEIYSGSNAMRATTIRFYQNFTGVTDCCDVGEDPCLKCDSVQIRYIPAESTMTIDGSTRTVTVKCKGMQEEVRAEHLTATPFSWPILQCIDYCVCVETDGATVAPDATVTILVIPREM